MKYFKESGVLRIENNRLKIIWNIEDDVEVSIFSLVDNVETFIEKVKGKNEFITNDFYKNKRCLFILKAFNYHYEIVGERLIPLEGVCHLRDIGGYKSEDGRRVKWNMFYRADKLSGMTDNDIRYIKNMNIKTKMEINSYQGTRHKKGLPVRGQSTRSNARTRKGKGKTVANKKK